MSQVLRLREHELHDALAGFDVSRSLVDELLWREVGDALPATTGVRTVGGWSLDPGTEHGDAVLHNSRGGLALSTTGLRAVRGAALTAVAARLFLSPNVVTGTVLGSGVAARLHVAALARHVPGVSHIAVHAADAAPADLAAELERAGIGLTVTERGEDAVFGANLVVLADRYEPGAGRDAGQLAPGAVVVNATGAPPPSGVHEQAGQVFVDDRRLAPWTGPVAADLGQVLAGTHTGRVPHEGVVLVDLLGAATGGLWLAFHLYQAALRLGLGVRVGAAGRSRHGNEGGTAS
jgi:ornithine cyclodeaminase/alanine dehydrogenase-like protein (mu-crystallin family)